MLRAGLEPATCRSASITGSAPARSRSEGRRKANPPGIEPGPARLELAVLPLHHGFVSGRPGSNGPPRGGAPVLFRLSYVREMNQYARLESNRRPEGPLPMR